MSERRSVFSPASTSLKRDSLAAELERDPQTSTAKRQQRTQAFSTSLTHASLERQLVSAQTVKMELESKLREREIQIEKLERDRRWFADREQEEREEKERERAEFQEQTANKDKELRSLRSSFAALREEHDELKDTHSALSRNSAQTTAAQKSQIATLTRQAAMLEEEVSQFRQLADERSNTIGEIQIQLEELQSVPQDAAVAAAGQEAKDMQIVREELHRQAAYLRELEVTNARLESQVVILDDRHTSIEVLREEKRGLQRKLQELAPLQEKVVQLEGQLEAARRERETWAQNQPEPSTSSDTPISLTHTISALRLQNAQLLEDHGATKALLCAKEMELVGAEERVAEARDMAEKLETQLIVFKDRALRAEQRASLADGEVSFMKALVSSYSLEEAQNKIEPDMPMAVDNARLKRMEQLEALLQEYKAEISKLSQQLNETTAREPVSISQERQQELEQAQTAREEAQKALEVALEESREQLERIEQLEQELHDLGGEIAGGRRIPPGIRVLSFADTPELLTRDNPQARKVEVDNLKAENAELIKRIEALEQGGASPASSAMPEQTWISLRQERDDLQQQARQKDKRLKRLQEVYSSKAEEFRETIASLLGVKIAFFQSGQVRVTSIFDLSATFVFKPDPSSGSGSLQLVGTGEGGPEDCSQLMNYWVGEEQCIPGFLAAVTHESFDRKKRREREEAEGM
ncbi:hypothetical protein MKEN_00257700 [Mycena kentingensis (nom. inval.)]|nr:hypothetical protein MKEN_00257700 [Mycena kentingensis (nom. inval.)]